MQLAKRPTDDVRRQITLLMQELEALRDDTKLQVQPAGMELRDRWIRFEQRHAQLREAVRHVRDEALEALRAALMDHRAVLTDLRDDLQGDSPC